MCVVVLVFSQSSLMKMLENLNLSDEGNLCVIGSDGSLILCRSSDQQWLSEKQFTVEKTGSLKEQMLTVTGTKDGITALQMDIKIHGLTRPIVEEAIRRTREANSQRGAGERRNMIWKY